MLQLNVPLLSCTVVKHTVKQGNFQPLALLHGNAHCCFPAAASLCFVRTDHLHCCDGTPCLVHAYLQ